MGEAVVGAVLSVAEERDLEGAVGVDEVDKETVQRRLQPPQSSCRAMKGRAWATVLEVSTLGTELAKEPVVIVPSAMESDTAYVVVTMSHALKRVC